MFKIIKVSIFASNNDNAYSFLLEKYKVMRTIKTSFVTQGFLNAIVTLKFARELVFLSLNLIFFLFTVTSKVQFNLPLNLFIKKYSSH